MTAAMEETRRALGIQDQGDGRFLLSGHLSLETVPEALARGPEVFRDSENPLLDLTEVERADSAGLALLVGWARAAQHRGRRIRLVNVPRQLRNLASVCGVDRVLSFEE
jgi:phospholipid transport system transporter-binding protein